MRRLFPLLFMLACGDKAEDTHTPAQSDDTGSDDTGSPTGEEGGGDDGGGEEGGGDDGGGEEGGGDDGGGDDGGGDVVFGTPSYAVTIAGAQPDDQAGTIVGSAGDIDGDGVDETYVGVPGADRMGTLALFGGPLDQPAYTMVDSDQTLRFELDWAWTGLSAVPLGDDNADGYDDIAVGLSPLYGNSSFTVAYVLYGPLTTSAPEPDVTVEFTDLRWSPEDSDTQIRPGGDLTGDGEADLLVGVGLGGYYMGDYEGDHWSLVYLLEGPVDDQRVLPDHSVSTLTWEETNGCFTGDFSGVGDADGDGFDDLLLGNPCDSEWAGAGWLYEGPVGHNLDHEAADLTIAGVEGQDMLGRDVDLGCDLDGDGRLDLVLSSIGADSLAGATRVFPGGSSSAGDSLLATEAPTSITGWATGSQAGKARCAGDVDGDGQDDLWTGAPYDETGGEEAGGTWLFLGPLSGSLGPEDAVVSVLGETGDHLETAVPAGDLDEDGREDTWIAVPEHADSEGTVGLILTSELITVE